MSDMNQDTLDRLSATLEQWNDQLASSQRHLAETLEAARGRLSHLASQGAEASNGELKALRDALAQKENELRDLHVAVASLQAELETLNANAQAPMQDHAELEAELSKARDQLQAQHDTHLQVLENVLDEERARAAQLREKLAQVTRERDEARAALAQPHGVPTSQAAPAPQEEEAIPAFDAAGHKRRMGEILVDMGVLSREQLDLILREQSREPHRRLGALVVSRGYSNEELVARILAAQLRLPYMRIQSRSVDRGVAGLISAHLARHHKCCPVRMDGDTLLVAMANPLDLIALEDLELSTGRSVQPVVATSMDIEDTLFDLFGAN